MLELSKLAKKFGSRLLYKNVDMQILPASIHLLQGANGSGKSTLLKIITGLVQADAGQINTELSLQDIGYLGHATFLYSQLTAKENLRFWLSVHTDFKINEKLFDMVLERVNLTRFANEKAGIFSRGMAQRLNIARILLQKPRLLLLDEPSTGLDLLSKQILLEEIQKAKENNAAVLWISHDIEHDKQYADILHTIENKILSTERVCGGQYVPSNA